MKAIKNRFLNNFLEENGYYPDFEEGEWCYYRRSRKLSSLLEKYQIRYQCFPNKL